MFGTSNEKDVSVRRHKQLNVGRKWGQHFLNSPGVVEKIIAAADPSEGEVVVEIGPGKGVITLPLCKRSLRVHAFEIDRDLADHLDKVGPENLSVHRGDFLKSDPKLQLGPDASRDLIVAANLPYYITAPILERLFWQQPLSIKRAVLMMQREVALRVCRPASRDAGALTYIVGAFFEAKYLFKVPPGCFTPPPKVDSAVIELVPHKDREDGPSLVYEKLVAAAFQGRRKQLGRSLRALHPDAPDVLERCGIESRRRPETLTVQEFWKLARNWPDCE